MNFENRFKDQLAASEQTKYDFSCTRFRRTGVLFTYLKHTMQTKMMTTNTSTTSKSVRRARLCV